MQTIYIENHTSYGTMRPTELAKLVEALQQQTKDFNTSPWVEHGYCRPIEVKHLTSGAPPFESINLILLDTISVAGALGYHEDVTETKIPVSYIGVKECREDDVSIVEVSSHEMLEASVDPFVNNENELRISDHNGIEYIVEVCDPSQGCGYKAPNGEELANFVWPKWFDLPQTRPSFTQDFAPIHNEFELAPEGYISIKKPGQEWTQIFGDKRKELPPWSERLNRIGNL